MLSLCRLSRAISFFVHDRPKATSCLILQAGWILTVLAHTAGIGIATAQMAPITPFGLNTQVSDPIAVGEQTQYDITGGTRPGGGANLFHSFGDFNVPLNNIANFLNDTGLPTSNILARVTGLNGNNPTRSSIDGIIQTTGFENANLFLMNPAGFLFGPNATLNVGGVVAFTSADYLKLTDNVQFNAIPNANADAQLTALPVASFGFLGSNPEAITVQGSRFTVTDGQSISLVGGTISIESGTPEGGTAQAAQLSAPNGNILLASAASPGEFDVATLQPLPNVDGLSFTSSGSVALALGSNIDVSGTSTVSIRGGQFVLSVNDATLTTSESPAADTILLSQGSSIVTSNSGAEAGADVQISSGTLQMDGAFILSSALSEGKGGDIQISAQTVTLNTGFIGTTASAVAAGGDLTVTAVEAVDLQGGSVLFSSTDSTDSTQNGGNISVHGNTVALRNGSNIFSQSQGSGQGGTITVTAEESILITSPADAEFPSLISSTAGQAISGEDTTGDGGAVVLSASSITIGDSGTVMTQTSGSAKAGDITVHTDKDLTMKYAGTILTSSGGSGSSGTIQITAGGTVSLVGNFDSNTSSRIISSSGSIGDDAGESGYISIDAERVTLTDGARIFNDTVNAEAGDILIQARDSVLLSGGSRITARSALRDAGSLSISGSSITVEGLGTGLSTQSIGPGNAGDISLMATSGSLIFSGGSDIKTLTGQSTGAAGAIMANAADSIEMSGGATLTSSSFGPAPSGPITISAGNVVSLSGPGTGVFSEAFGTGDGGNISINGTQVQLANGAIISARSGPVQGTAGTGNAGNISIDAGQQFQMRDSSVKTEAALASGGNIDIQAVDRVRLVNSSISTSVLGGAGSGGNITIDPNSVILQNSQILAQAIQGAGGNITIFTPLFLTDSKSLVSASSQFGLNGTVTIQSPASNLSGSLGPLSSTPNQAQNLVTQRCAALANSQASSFVVAGREQLPADPGSWLTSPLALAELGENLNTGNPVASAPTVMAMAAQNSGTVSLRRLTPAGFLIANFADSEATACHS